VFRDRKAIKRRIVLRVLDGETLKAAARACGVSYSTLHRWRQADAKLKQELDIVAWSARQERELQYRLALPRPLPVRKDCPACGRGEVRGRRAMYSPTFWCCSAGCGWASWRPPHPEPCPCGAVRYWSQTRKSIGCPGCGRRVFVVSRSSISETASE
jgi:hypothetical protein